MPGFKRAGPSSTVSRKRSRPTSSKKILPSCQIYLVQAKLAPSTISKLIKLTERHVGRLCQKIEDADVVITGIGMRKRLERHVPPSLMKEKAIVTPEWLEQSVENGKLMPYRDYAALTETNNGAESDASVPTRPASPRSSNLDHTAKLACQRASPLVCPNQYLVLELNVIRRSRELDGNSTSALSYSRAIGALKACPYEIKSIEQAAKLPYIGPKITHKIEEYLSTRHISETQIILKDDKYHVLDNFASVYGIGPATARNLYFQGLRTLEDLERHYKVPPDLKSTTQQSRVETITTESWVDVSLALKKDLSVKIPREEVEQMCEVVMKELNVIQPGCSHMIVGGYRRGKTESNDVDIVITHPDVEKVKGLCQRVTERLANKGLVTHLMTMTGLSNPVSSHKDVLEKALTIFCLPGSKISRRLDLIFAVLDVYWTAVVGWTGSTMFERDLRLFAKSKHLKFDSTGITHRHNEKPIVAHSEEEVFKILGLEWIDPLMRNADA